MTDWREAHRRRVAELEAAATALMTRAMDLILDDVAGRFAAVTASAEDQANLDDLAQINTAWGYAVDDVVLPYFGGIFEAGAAAAGEQVAAIRGAGVVIPAGDPALLNHAAVQFLAGTRQRFIPLSAAVTEAARTEVLAGFRAGEGIATIRRRIQAATGLARGTAEAIARTEVIAASNMGAQARVDLMGADAPRYRQWLSTMDARTRPTHVRADGQVVPATERFEVGSARLRVPGDPSGPAAEVINCRCTVLFTDSPEVMEVPGRQDGGVVDEVARDTDGGTDVDRLPLAAAAVAGPDQVDTLTGEPHTGAMIALIPADPEGLALDVDRAEPPEALHMTLAYLGDSTAIPARAQDALVDWLDGMAAATATIDAHVFGAAVWNTQGDEPSMVLNVGGQRLVDVHAQAWDGIWQVAEATGWTPPENHVPWVAHVCMAYGAAELMNPPMVAAAAEGPITFDRLRLALGGQALDFALAGAPPEEENPDMDRDELAAALRAGMNLTLNQLGMAAVEDDAPPADAPPAEEPDDDGAPPAQPGEHFRATMHVRGTSTGDGDTGRVFLNTDYRVPPFSMNWQMQSSAHGGLPTVVHVGNVTRVVEVGPALYAFGVLDLAGADGGEYGRRLATGIERWVSMGLDETRPAKVTLTWPPIEPEDPDDDGTEMESLIPILETIDGGRIGELTGVSVPAQADATIEPTDELLGLLGVAPVDEPMPEDEPMAASAHSAGSCGCGGACGGCGPARVPAVVAARPAALVAAAHTITLDGLPPEAWFQEPTDVDMDGAFCVTDEGRIYGLLAPFGTGHRAWARSGGRREAPRGNVDYTRFMGAWALTAEGRTHAGPLTIDCGHAPIHRADHDVAPEHYDNACSVIGAVAVGESERLGGTWMAGALLPGVKPEQVARALACRCSGDWQPHPDQPGVTELIACLLVPSPGFGSAHPATTTYRGDALVASSVPVRYVPTAAQTEARRRAAAVLATADLVGRTPAARVLAALDA